uniref:Uncharacterized protein n=1 Tax=Siphoviridae sp. ctmxA102 TaxID=2825657 RepID=A0A8S5TVX1_9CAUD|nr:MAG TPA: hypothetical protein [Siphoviridae sp. ctmxA102]
MGNVKIDIRVNRDEGMYVETEGTCEDILKCLAQIAIEVTANMSVKHAMILRRLLCNMIMSTPDNED